MLRVKHFVLLAMAVTGFTACLPSPDCFQEHVFCAALVTDTQGINDHGINQDAWLGLEQAKANNLADQIDYIASVDSRDYSKNIAYFVEHGYDVIFTSGIALQDETLQSADLYPDSVFVGLNQPFEETRPNLISITFPEDQMGFAAGVLAARLSQTGIVAGVCETSGIDSMWRYCEGFRAGVEYLPKEAVTVLVAYRDQGDREKLFLDDKWGYEAADSFIRRGADVVFAAGGVTGQGALRAASDLKVMSIGVERDQAAALGGSGLSVVTSFFGRTSFEVQEVMRLPLGELLSGAHSGQIQFISLNPMFSPDLGGEIEALLTMLGNGEIQTRVTQKSR